jgi:hypothetical protein
MRHRIRHTCDDLAADIGFFRRHRFVLKAIGCGEMLEILR